MAEEIIKNAAGRPPRTGDVSSVPEIERAPLRVELHEKVDHLARAKQRVSALQDQLNSLSSDSADEFYIPKEIIPDGWTYEWKRWSVLNAEDPHYINSLRRTGWDFVPSERHPELLPLNSTEKILLHKGMVLMERPKEVTDFFTKKNVSMAQEQIESREEQLTNPPQQGQFERSNKGRPLTKVNKTWEKMPIPD
jgi:hypothetical protein